MNSLLTNDCCNLSDAGNQRPLYGYREMDFQTTYFKILASDMWRPATKPLRRPCRTIFVTISVRIASPGIAGMDVNGAESAARGVCVWQDEFQIDRLSTYRGATDDCARMAAESYVTRVLPCIRLKTSQSNCLGVTAWSGIGLIDPRSP